MKPETEQIIKEFLQAWYSDLSWQVSQTVLDAGLPPLSTDQLYDQLLGLDLQVLGSAVDGALPRMPDNTDEVIGICQKLLEWMFARPGMGAEYSIPAAYWETPIGWLSLRAYLWAEGDELITVTEAARLLGKPLSTVASMVKRGNLTGYVDPAEPNPRKRTRVSRNQVENLER